MTDFRALSSLLAGAGVEFIIVGGAAATAHGSARLTLALDIVTGERPQTSRASSGRSPHTNPTSAARRRACPSPGTSAPSRTA